jgi:hypothetical protein
VDAGMSKKVRAENIPGGIEHMVVVVAIAHE